MWWLRRSGDGRVDHGFIVRCWDLERNDRYFSLFGGVKGYVNAEDWSYAASMRKYLDSVLASWDAVEEVGEVVVCGTRRMVW